MALTPENAPDSMIRRMSEAEAAALAREAIAADLARATDRVLHPADADGYVEHPMAARLYRRFKAGSRTMTKDEAWNLGNELDRLAALVPTARERRILSLAFDALLESIAAGNHDDESDLDDEEALQNLFGRFGWTP